MNGFGAPRGGGGHRGGGRGGGGHGGGGHHHGGGRWRGGGGFGYRRGGWLYPYPGYYDFYGEPVYLTVDKCAPGFRPEEVPSMINGRPVIVQWTCGRQLLGVGEAPAVSTTTKDWIVPAILGGTAVVLAAVLMTR